MIHVEPSRALHDARRVLPRLLLRRDDDRVRGVLEGNAVRLAEGGGVGEARVDLNDVVGYAEAPEDLGDPLVDRLRHPTKASRPRTYVRCRCVGLRLISGRMYIGWVRLRTSCSISKRTSLGLSGSTIFVKRY